MTEFFSSTKATAELFEPFFESGMEETVSPFLTLSSRNLGKNIKLKASLFASLLLIASFIFSLIPDKTALSQFFLLLTFFFAGVPALISSLRDLAKLEINIDVLMVLAAFLSIFIGSGKEGALLLVLFSFSAALERAVSAKAKGAIYSLKQLSPRFAHVIKADGTLRAVSIKELSPGALILVKAGEIVPLDGEIVAGSSCVNLVHLTGESLPLFRGVGDKVQAGASNLDGALTVKVTHTSSDSTIARIIDLIIKAQETKPKLQRWFDEITNRYSIVVISLSFIFALCLPLFFPLGYLGKEGSIYRALAFLITASPCALILAIPIAYLSAISSCASQGIILKGGMILDALSRCKTMAVDKTGTLTEGKLHCTEAPSGLPLQVAYALEQNTHHPIATAICEFAEKNKCKPVVIEQFTSISGSGVEALYAGEKVYLGSAEWILAKLPGSSYVEGDQASLRALLLFEGRIYGFTFKDLLRKETLKTLQLLQQKEKIKVIMLTGDHFGAAAAIAKEAHIEEFYADLKPEDKLAHIERLAKAGDLIMVGDGINDAPALARANVGIAMGAAGSYTAISAADIILLQDKIEKLGWLIRKSHSTIKIVKQNVCLAAAAICFATLPALLGMIPLWLAVLLHEGGTVIVGINALRLLRR